MNKHLIWAATIFSIVLMICGTLIWINYNSWTLRFEMDDNTRGAIESIDYKEIAKIGKIEPKLNTSCKQTRCSCADWGCLAMCWECNEAYEVRGNEDE